MSERMDALRRLVKDEIEASMLDAATTVAENLAEKRAGNGWSDAEISAVLMEEDVAFMERFRTIGFCPAWEDLE